MSKILNEINESYNLHFKDDGYHERNGQAYCQQCHAEAYAPRCGGCSTPIIDNYISSLGMYVTTQYLKSLSHI